MIKLKKILVYSLFALILTAGSQLPKTTDHSFKANRSDASIQRTFNADEIIEDVVDYSAADAHSVALTNTGKVFTWGNGANGALGNASFGGQRMTPIEITSSFPAGEEVAKVFAGFMNGAAITKTNRIFVWGDNQFRQLGTADSFAKSVPTEITSIFPETETIIQLEYGRGHVAALTDSGRLFTWGNYNYYGQLGNGTLLEKLTPFEITSSFPVEDKITSISLGAFHSGALTSSGKVFTWGYNSDGQLGQGITADRQSWVTTPTEITSLYNVEDPITQIELGGLNSFAISTSGRVFAWGNNAESALGDGTTSDKNAPTEITAKFPSGTKIVHVGASDDNGDFPFAAAKSDDGRLFTWGSNVFGQNGNGNTILRQTTPVDISSKFPVSELTESFELGGSFNLAKTTNGNLYSWGYNNAGQLGLDDTTSRNLPTKIKVLSQPVITTISFESNGGSTVDSISQNSGSAVVAPTNPTKVGHTFVGWYSDQALTTAYTFSNMPETNITLYAKWSVNQYTMTFITNGGSSVANMIKDYGASISAPENPTRIGYTFVGWYSDEQLTTAYSFSTMPAQNVTVYAKWSVNQYTITFIANGASPIASITQDFGTTITKPANPTREGFTFNGYSMAIPETMPAQNLEIEVYWVNNTPTTSGDVNAVANGIIEALSSDLIGNRNVEIVLSVSTIEEANVPSESVTLVSKSK